MSEQLDDQQIQKIQQYDAQQRYQYLIKEVLKNKEIWLLIDEHGCVMLNTEEEDCVPVWPNKEFAQAWATEEWSHCKAESISLEKWHNRWTHGLEGDELAIVVFPDQNCEGLIFFPDEFDLELQQHAKKNSHKKQH
ncbi:DUF2750 domain-containing protein [Psychromonas antarctica]|uniref:DUF2750 domain-containing protein n=1 Tax=Psychromonas antarctica TaxID=67573 RepID=UPI001EE8A593|nr:DUF2750 domain-containing protein [Psychromonas antarctica]MCG6201118.1 DUF2750 domain-containing protein [Psychromonas antarctica]